MAIPDSDNWRLLRVVDLLHSSTVNEFHRCAPVLNGKIVSQKTLVRWLEDRVENWKEGPPEFRTFDEAVKLLCVVALHDWRLRLSHEMKKG